jgi:hypothetical protein
VKAPAVHFNRNGRPRCGARPRVPLLADGESGVTCGHCTAHLNGTYGVGNRWCDPKACGTPAAYRRHLRHDGKPVRCEACLKAESERGRDTLNERRRERYAAHRAAGLSAREASLRRDLRRAA